MATKVSGKVVFVTGGASGIGAALAAELAVHGAEVWIADLQIDEARELARRLSDAGGHAHAVELDVRNYPAFQRALSEVVQCSGRIDYLFNNAAIGVAGEIDSYALEDWYDVFDVSLRGVIHGIQAVYPIMIAQGSGHIVNTASMSGLVTTTGQASYSATKHAVVAISQTLRLEAKLHGVQVSVLCPGAVRTPAITGGRYGRADRYREEGLRSIAERGHPMEPEKFARRALRAVLRRRAIIVIPAWWKSWWYLERLSPTLSMQFAKLVMLTPMRAIERSRHPDD
jgi:NAD(P)-dependent dehydrogenase (short-subunit alcohol dehydrogenase family)